MQKYCKVCGHRCHCLGKGYYVSETFCENCSCSECKCDLKPLILGKNNLVKRSKKFETYTICILLILILLVSLLSCVKEEKKYPNKMDTIANGLSTILTK